MHPNADTIRQLAEQRHDQRVADVTHDLGEHPAIGR
jgi:hypothetical protein